MKEGGEVEEGNAAEERGRREATGGTKVPSDGESGRRRIFSIVESTTREENNKDKKKKSRYCEKLHFMHNV